MSSQLLSEGPPPHHRPEGGFRNPWGIPTRGASELLRWQRERSRKTLAPNPPAEALPAATPRIAYPRAPEGELRITWIGHATFLIQIGGFNVLTDPHWSRRASPVQFAGPARFVPPGVRFAALPPIDAVVISHDHYDHLDARTVRRLSRRFGGATRWFTALGYADWMRRRGASPHLELDWWESAELAATPGPAERSSQHLRVTALPAQHWSSRDLWRRGERLWASWSLTAADGRSVYFAGDSGYFPGFREIGDRFAPFSALLLPIGAYDPRWFMSFVHMNPEEAVAAYLDLGGSGVFAAMHWGTWRLTDEDPLEPPRRAEAAWTATGLEPSDLWIARHGETRILADSG